MFKYYCFLFGQTCSSTVVCVRRYSAKKNVVPTVTSPVFSVELDNMFDILDEHI